MALRSAISEFRRKTITPVVLITYGRTPLLVAKLITMAAAGLAFGLAATGMAVAITLPLLAARHIPAGMSGTQAAAIIAGGGVATALAAALGVGVGAIIRNQARLSADGSCRRRRRAGSSAPDGYSYQLIASAESNA
jgi:ABC-2 type transport system permease protein